MSSTILHPYVNDLTPAERYELAVVWQRYTNYGLPAPIDADGRIDCEDVTEMVRAAAAQPSTERDDAVRRVADFFAQVAA